MLPGFIHHVSFHASWSVLSEKRKAEWTHLEYKSEFLLGAPWWGGHDHVERRTAAATWVLIVD